MKQGARAAKLLFPMIILAFFSSTVSAASLNSADISWVSVSAILVMLMTPALGFFYAGLVRKKNLVSTLAQCIAIFAVVSIIWVLFGYGLVFGKSIHGLIGSDGFFLNGVGIEPNPSYSSTIPALLFFFFQLKFAAITPALIIGAFAERVNFKSLLIFVSLWVLLIYCPVAHWIWNTDGWLKHLGAIDFAGGTVVHITAGVSALAAAFVIGRRKDADCEFKPNNIPFVILGAALLWFGWFGFNAGSALAADGVAVTALVVTNISAAAAAISWMVVDWYKKGKPSATGMAIGAVCGLVAITPASGYVGVISAMLIGAIAGIISNIVANLRARTKLDDCLDVFACHGVSGIWGALATGIFASIAVNAAGANGLIHGNPYQLVLQLIAVIVVAIFSFAGSFVILKVMGKFTNLRVSAEEEEKGLDHSQHGEEAYS